MTRNSGTFSDMKNISVPGYQTKGREIAMKGSGSPAPRGSDGGRRRLPVLKVALRAATVVLLLAFFVDVSSGGDVGRLTVVNDTEYYVHVIVDGDPFLYVPPGAGAVFEKEGYSRVVAKVFYSPGQGVSGSAERTFTVSPYDPASTGCEWNNMECTSTPPSGGPLSWEVTADTLAVSDNGTVIR